MSPPTRSGPHREEGAAGTAACMKAAEAVHHSVHPATDWGVPPDHPLPEVSRRAAQSAEVSTSASVLAEAATADGWAVQLTFARGARLDRYGNPGKVTDSLAVRLSRGNRRAVATFLNGSFKTGWNWTTAPATIPRAVAYRPLLGQVAEAVAGDA